MFVCLRTLAKKHFLDLSVIFAYCWRWFCFSVGVCFLYLSKISFFWDQWLFFPTFAINPKVTVNRRQQ